MAKPKAAAAAAQAHGHAQAADSAGTTMTVRNPEQSIIIPTQRAVAKQDEQPEPLKMEAGTTYVTRLPGHSRPVFVRKRRYVREYSQEFPIGFTAIARGLFSPRRQRSYSVEEKHVVRVASQPNITKVRVASPPVIYPQPAIYPRPAYHTVSSSPVVTRETVQTYPGLTTYQTSAVEQPVILQHQCGSCGKRRSAGFQRRHPIAPGEIPNLSICRRCTRNYTSSDTTDDDIQLLRESRRKYRVRRKYRKTKRSYITTSSDTDCTTSEEEIRVIRKARSLSRTRSVSREHPTITVTLDSASAPTTRIIRRQSSVVQPVEYIHYPRRSSHYDEYTDENPVEYEYHRRSYSTNRTHSPYRGRRIVSYGYDGDYAVESDRRAPHISHRRSSSVAAEHGTPYKERDIYFQRPRYRSPSPGASRRQIIERIDGYESAPAGPSRSARVIHVSHENGIPYEVRGHERIALDTRRSLKETSTSKHSRHHSEIKEFPVRHHHGNPRVVELDSSDEYSVSGTYPVRPARIQRHSERQRIDAPPVRYRHVYSTASFDADVLRGTTYNTRTRVSPEHTYQTYIPPPAPTPVSVPREVETFHSTRYEREPEDRTPRRYYYVSDDAVFFPET